MPSTDAPEPDRPSDPPAPSSPPAAPVKAGAPAKAAAPRRRVPVGLLVGLLALALAGGAVAGLQYRSYAAVHLRKPLGLPGCLIKARQGLRKPVLASGTEPRENADGETVYLTEAEDRAVGCAYLIDVSFSRKLAGALAEHDPVRRAQGLVKLIRETPADPAFDKQAASAFMFASYAFKALPEDNPEVSAASTEAQLLQACRFDTKQKCPTRPPIPAAVWLTGVPAAGATLGLAWIGGSAGVSALRGWWARRKQRKPAKR